MLYDSANSARAAAERSRQELVERKRKEEAEKRRIAPTIEIGRQLEEHNRLFYEQVETLKADLALQKQQIEEANIEAEKAKKQAKMANIISIISIIITVVIAVAEYVVPYLIK